MNNMKDAKICPRGFTRTKGVCAGKPSKYGGREVLLEVDVKVSDEFRTWAYSAKDRLLDHFDREHASDFTQGNVDYHVKLGNWKDATLFGEISLKVPKHYFDDCDGADDFIDVGNAAMSDTINYELSRFEKDIVKEYDVKVV